MFSRSGLAATVLFFSLSVVVNALCFATPTKSNSWSDRLLWEGPIFGPQKQANKKIFFIAHDFRNGGITTLYRSFYLATTELSWNLHTEDGKGDNEKIRVSFVEAIRAQPDAIVLAGIDLNDSFDDLCELAQKSKIVLIGWHTSSKPGPTKRLFVNITTKAEQVAKDAIDLIRKSRRTQTVGIVLINDNRFEIANTKTSLLKASIAKCNFCRLLTTENIEIGNVNSEIPIAAERWNKLYGKEWTHTVAINDAYFDAINVQMSIIKRNDIQNISAGDGSYIALSRIKSGRSQQIASVAEPIGVQGWQIADELNRAFAGQPPSGFIAKPIVVTTALLHEIQGDEIDQFLKYKIHYRAIWFQGSGL
jgi:ribose transport system substrate-binding protein